MITHTNRALPDLPLLTDQVCRKADSDGVTPGWAGYLPGLPILTDQAFDREEHRPGRGDGYHLDQVIGYDTSLKGNPPHGINPVRTNSGHPV